MSDVEMTPTPKPKPKKKIIRKKIIKKKVIKKKIVRKKIIKKTKTDTSGAEEKWELGDQKRFEVKKWNAVGEQSKLLPTLLQILSLPAEFDKVNKYKCL